VALIREYFYQLLLNLPAETLIFHYGISAPFMILIHLTYKISRLFGLFYWWCFTNI